MNTLRLLLRAPATAGQPLPWALHDASGACLAHGHDAADAWPAADRMEIVIGANQVRLASVTLPPIAPPRIPAAVAFALEDQLAHGGDDAMLAASPQGPDGQVVVAILARSLLSGIRANSGEFGMVTRVIAEPELASTEPGWCWCAPDDATAGDGFVRRADGSAFPVGARPADGALPPELALALAHAARTDKPPARVRVDATAGDSLLARWTEETGVAFVRGTPWRWHAAPAAAYARATTLLQGEFAATPPVRSGERARLFVPALAIAAAALVLHVAATLGEWAWWRIDAWRTGRSLASLAVAAGVDPAAAATPSSAQAALSRIYAEQRHAHGLPAPGDALPLLARAAPALTALPPGALKSAVYADGHWTLDLQRIDAQAVRDLEVRLRQAGTPAVIAPTPTGARLRLTAS